MIDKKNRPSLSELKVNSFEHNPPHIIIAENRRKTMELLVYNLSKLGYIITTYSDNYKLLDHLIPFLREEKHDKIDLIITEAMMPGITGIDILIGYKFTGKFPPMILLTEFGDNEILEKAEKYGATAVFVRPLNITTIIRKVREIVSVN